MPEVLSPFFLAIETGSLQDRHVKTLQFFANFYYEVRYLSSNSASPNGLNAGFLWYPPFAIESATERLSRGGATCRTFAPAAEFSFHPFSEPTVKQPSW